MTDDDATPAARLRDVGDNLAHAACDLQSIARDIDHPEGGHGRVQGDDTARADGGTPASATAHPAAAGQQWQPRPVDDAGYRQTMSKLAFGGSGLGLMYAGTAFSGFEPIAGLFALLLAIGAGYYGVRLRTYDPEPSPQQGGGA